MKVIIPISLVILTFSCNSRKKIEDKKPDVNKHLYADKYKNVTDTQQSRSSLMVSAHLIYEDGTLSSFDILNDKTIALWNTIIGGGDALKPSNSTKVRFIGNLDSLNIKVKNGLKLVIDTTVIQANKELEYVVKNTGCNEVYIRITKINKLVYADTIPFHCGE